MNVNSTLRKLSPAAGWILGSLCRLGGALRECYSARVYVRAIALAGPHVGLQDTQQAGQLWLLVRGFFRGTPGRAADRRPKSSLERLHADCSRGYVYDRAPALDLRDT